MKLIDVLTGKETPKKFKYNTGTFERQNNGGYIDEDGDNLTAWIFSDYSNIYDKIKIIEEDKPAIAREELENRIENALEFLETQYNTFPSGEMWRKALKNVLKGKEPDDVYKPFLEEEKKIEKINYYATNRVKNEFAVDYIENGETKKFCLNKKQRYFADKINELIDKVNNMENNK